MAPFLRPCHCPQLSRIRAIVVAVVVACLLFPYAGKTAGIDYHEPSRSWTLKSGPVEYRLAETKGVLTLVYFGPPGRTAWPEPKPRLRNYARFDLGGQVEGQFLRPEDFELVGQKIDSAKRDCPSLDLTLRHRHLPLEVAAHYQVWGETGVITRQLTLFNRGVPDLKMEATPSLEWLLPPNEYSLEYLHGGWGEERQLAKEEIGFGMRSFVNRTGRSTNGYSPWFCLRDDHDGVRYAAQLAYSGNWEMSFERFTERRLVPASEQDLIVKMGLRHDFGAAGRLIRDRAFALPLVAFTASTGDLDDIANQLHRYQRTYVMPALPEGGPLLTQCNTFESLGRAPLIKDLKRYADYAVELGLESIAPDASWVVKTKAGETLYGDWREDPIGFPEGIKELADYAHAKWLKFGLWFEPESISKFSPIAIAHPDWILKHNGIPMQGTRDRVYVDFRRADVRAWTRAVVDRLAGDVGIDWLKIDYNADVRESFDPASENRTGTVLHDHLENLNAWLDEIRLSYPKLIIENCSSGALRFDLSTLAHTHFNWRSDVTTPRSSIQLAYGATVEFPAEASYHWMSGEDQAGHFDSKSPRGWWDFMFRIDMMGHFGVAGRIDDWTPEMKQCAKDNIALYKRIRGVIKGADTFHLTPPPDAGENPTGWMTLQYVAPDSRKSVVMAFRLAKSRATENFQLRGLDPALTYTIVVDGNPPSALPSSARGQELAATGLQVALDTEWRSAVIELTASP